MKQIYILLIFSFFLISCVTDFKESDGMIRTKSNIGKFGFKDINGNQVIDNIFADATDFKNGISIITKKDLKSRLGTFQGVINKKGEFLIEPKYLSIEFIDDEFIKVCKEIAWNDKLCSVYNTKGEEIIPMVIADVHNVYDSKYFDCSMNNNGTTHYLFDLNGKKIADYWFSNVNTYSKDIIIVSRKNKETDRYSEFKVLDLKYPNSSLNKQNSSDYIELFNPKQNRNQYLFKKNDNYIFDINGKRIDGFRKYKRVSNYGDGFFVVENNDSYLDGYSDLNGNLKFNFVFLKADAFKNGKAKVSIGGDSDFFIDKNGKCVSGDCPSERLMAYNNIKSWVVDKTEYKRLVKKGLNQMDYKDYQLASQYFTESIGEFSMDYEAFYNRGICNFMLGNINDALKDYDKAIELNPNNANSYYLRGSARQKRKRQVWCYF